MSSASSTSPDRQLVGPSHANEIRFARLGQPEPGRYLQRRARSGAPRQDRRNEVPRLAKTGLLCAAQAAVHLDARNEVFATHATTRPARQIAERARRADAVAKLEAFVRGQVLLDDDVLREVPGPDRARHNELAFELVLVLFAQFSDGLGLERSLADNFLLDSACLVDGLVLDIDHGIQTVLAFQRSEPMLPAPPGKRGSIVARSDSLQVQLGRPPPSDPVLQFQPGRGVTRPAGLRQADSGGEADLEIAGLFEV